MHRLVRRPTYRASQPARRLLDLEHDLAGRGLKVYVDHSPGGDESGGLGEERFHRQSVTPAPHLLQELRLVNHTRRERALILCV